MAQPVVAWADWLDMRIGAEGPRHEFDPAEPERALDVRPSHEVPRPFREALRGLGRTIDRGEAAMERAVRGNLGSLDSAQLLALQAGIYHYSEAVDLVAKLVDRASSAARTVLSPH